MFERRVYQIDSIRHFRYNLVLNFGDFEGFVTIRMLPFLRRHQQKLTFVGTTITAVAGGVYLAGKYMAQQRAESEVLERRSLLQKTKHRHHFQSVLR